MHKLTKQVIIFCRNTTEKIKWESKQINSKLKSLLPNTYWKSSSYSSYKSSREKEEDHRVI